MIKASELRIGNFISDDDGVLAKIIGFAPFDHSDRCDEEEGCKLLVDCYHANGSRRSGCETNSPECKPIPLTPEWMERCGGKKNKGTPFYCIDMPSNIGEIHINPDNGIIWLRHHSNEYTALNPYSGSAEYFLHQLQNLYHALTGEELQIKMP